MYALLSNKNSIVWKAEMKIPPLIREKKTVPTLDL